MPAAEFETFKTLAVERLSTLLSGVCPELGLGAGREGRIDGLGRARREGNRHQSPDSGIRERSRTAGFSASHQPDDQAPQIASHQAGTLVREGLRPSVTFFTQDTP